MGRVYDALKRAASDAGRGGASRGKVDGSERRNGVANKQASPAAKGGDDHPWDHSPLFASKSAAHTSASTAHTDADAGPALSGVTASRDAGATLDAARSARADQEFVSLDISAARVEPHLIAITQPRSAYCEQFRSLRTRVLQAGERKKMQAFVVTSAGVAEGKTLMALNLSWLLAQADGVRALFIDGDLRQPCAAEYLGIDAPLGLSDVLAGEATLEEAIIRLEPAGLHLLPGGSPREDVAEMLSGPRLSRVLADARRMFDYIIIDAPPLVMFTDATLLINRTDGTLLVVRAGKARYATVNRLLEQLPREKMLGVVLNRTEEYLGEGDYYYQRRYYPREGEREGPPHGKTTLNEEEVNALS
ncbi:MAG TPA: CpsD/CapB family tyrosine-protein kinase [Pyrinomonadaceae bacterium]|nr:CpsD/CapB family tyrosine-protein kinase [Pyrinomonadaceae bacterium]